MQKKIVVAGLFFTQQILQRMKSSALLPHNSLLSDPTQQNSNFEYILPTPIDDIVYTLEN
jgi:hypothetical protein